MSRERAVERAIAIADAEGLDALTMRALAKALKVEAMSLYHHFANKDAILDAMVDVVFAQISIPPELPDWKEAMAVRMRSGRKALRKHRWAIAVMESRTSPGVATLKHHDAMLGALRRGGFSIPLTAQAYALLDAFLYGFVLQENALPFETTEQAHEVAQGILTPEAAAAFPHLAELTREHVLKPGYAFADEFERGLTLIFDGLERLRAAGAARR